MVTEIPYQTSVEGISEKIADLANAGVIDGIREIRDERARGETRLVIELKRDANANVVLNNLYKHSPLQTTFGVNMVALVDGVPRTLTLRDALVHYVAHQIEVVTRRTRFRLDRARRRAHIVEGFLRALDIIDAIIAAIRASTDRAAAIEALQGEDFGFSEIQATEIVDMRLSTLTRLGREAPRGRAARLACGDSGARGDSRRRRTPESDDLGGAQRGARRLRGSSTLDDRTRRRRSRCGGPHR
ncbi:MAG: hypothetical protein M5U19_00870 [Microthrixaceae bacterium]|nr:hypothetical protein [Microthrixaceae bacterium]